MPSTPGWDRIGFPEYAAEEREHDALWSRFRTALDAIGEMHRPQSRTLLAVGENAFASVPEALGALYSFEVQQPATASSKLAGLREHYAGTVDADAQQYFVEHAVETDEPAMLAEPDRRPVRRRVRACEDGLRPLQRRGVGRPRRGLLHRLTLSVGC